jgi:hypothetical protein
MKNEREEPSSLKIYINIIFGDVTNSAVIQGGQRNTSSLQLPEELVKRLMDHIRGDTS